MLSLMVWEVGELVEVSVVEWGEVVVGVVMGETGMGEGEGRLVRVLLQDGRDVLRFSRQLRRLEW